MLNGLLRIGIVNEEPPYAEPHVRWCERSENESRRKLLHFPPTRFQALYLSFILSARVQRKIVKRDILHKNIAVEYDILHKLSIFNTIICRESLRLVVLCTFFYYNISGVLGNSGKNVEETEGNGNRGFLM